MNSEDNTPLIDAEDKLNCDDIFKQFNGIIDNLSAFKSQVYDMQQNIKLLEKNVRKQIKYLKKEVVKNKLKGNRKPSGFAKPTKVTKELCEFMNKKEGSEIARTEVTRALISYIKDNKLENKENSKFISPDTKLKYLLGLHDENLELTYFNIQKYMNKHFISNTNLEP
jgi:chromatin remodeling complex protein RSC6